MSNSSMKPSANEYAPYYGRYIDLVPAGDIVEILQQQMIATLNFFTSLTEEKASHRYAPGKWSIKEIVGHIVDSERIFAYRALRFARNDKSPLMGFEQDDYVINGDFDRRELSDLIKEYEHVRRASIDLFKALKEEAWERQGEASEAEVSVRALAWIICGHELHHEGVVRTKYL